MRSVEVKRKNQVNVTENEGYEGEGGRIWDKNEGKVSVG
jgi:hypothetical protein